MNIDPLLLEALKALHDVLPELRKGKDNGCFYACNGICSNVDDYLFAVYDGEVCGIACVRLPDIIARWPDMGAFNCIYPVGGHAEFEEERWSGAVWKNPRRIELLEWLIEELEK